MTADTAVVEAARQRMAAGGQWLVMVDGEGQPVGLIDRQGLLQALPGQNPDPPSHPREA